MCKFIKKKKIKSPIFPCPEKSVVSFSLLKKMNTYIIPMIQNSITLHLQYFNTFYLEIIPNSQKVAKIQRAFRIPVYPLPRYGF